MNGSISTYKIITDEAEVIITYPLIVTSKVDEDIVAKEVEIITCLPVVLKIFRGQFVLQSRKLDDVTNFFVVHIISVLQITTIFENESR